MAQNKSNIGTLRWSGNEYRVWIESVTPELAKKILDGDPGRNRRQRPQRVTRYASDMRAGKWRLTGEPVRLDENGVLLNGQHRMAAIIQSGCTVPLMFVSGISTSTMLVQDCGLPTSADDWMPIENAPAVTRLTRAVLRAFVPTLNSSVSRDEVLAAYNIIGPEHINWAIANTQKKGVCRKACVRAALALIRKLNPERAELFAKRISEQDLPADTPENKLHFAMTDRGKLSQDGEIMLAMRVVVATVRNEGVQRLFEAGDKMIAWLTKEAKLEQLSTIRRAVS